MHPLIAAPCLVAAYLLGTFPSALLAGRRRGVDPTRAGSGNPGATNVLRTAGRRAAVLTLVGDAGKGMLTAGLGWLVGGHAFGVACGVAAVVGHVFPVTRGFRGGKGVATAAGMVVVLFPLLALVGGVAFGLAVAVTRIVSIGSMAVAVVVPAAAALAGVPGRELAGLALASVLVVLRHAENIRMLLEGEEGTFRP